MKNIKQVSLDVIRPKNKKQDILIALTKNYEKPFKQTLMKPQETLEFKLTQPRNFSHFNPVSTGDLNLNGWLD